MNPPNLIKCPCMHCGVSLEFNEDEAGQEAECPSCHKQTWIDVPGKMNYLPPKAKSQFAPTAEAPAKPTYKPLPKTSFILSLVSVFTQLFAVGVLIVGVLLFLTGIGNEAAEKTSAIRQNVYVIQYCGGAILCAVSPIIFAAGRAMEWMDKHPAEKK